MSDSSTFFAHETAVIDPGCEIGEGTKIWHFSHVMPECRIGRNCNIGQNVVVSPGVVLGRGRAPFLPRKLLSENHMAV